MSLQFSFLSDDRWLPKSVLCLRDYSLNKFVRDVTAGITVGLVALPLAMAFAIASGLTPQAGLYCAVVTGFLVSALGGSRTQIAGPTGAFVVVVAGIVARHGVDGLFMCTMMAGVILVAMGLSGLGSAVTFIPRPVVVGFTNGIAVLIASTQIRDFFGLQVTGVPDDFVGRVRLLAAHFNTFSGAATLLGATTLAIVVITPRLFKKVPGTIVAMFGLTIVASAMHLPVETIGTRFGGVPSGLPHIVMPVFHVSLVLKLLSPAMTVALLGAIESLLSATVADRMSGTQHDPNVELMAQG